MKLLVIGSGMMGSAAAYDMARQPAVEAVTLADTDYDLALRTSARLNRLAGKRKITSAQLDAANVKAAGKLMQDHAAALSAVPYFFNEDLAKAAIGAGCHFADLGGNNTVVRKTYAMSRQAARAGVALAPDCGLSPGMASILAGELMRRLGRGDAKAAKADALKIYVGGLPEKPKPPFNYQLVFSIEGLINEYVEPARILRNGRIVEIEPLSEPEEFRIGGFAPLEAFHTSGGTSTLPESFAGRVKECFEKTIRYSGHLQFIRGLYDLGLFSSEKLRIGRQEVSPRQVTSRLFLEKMSGDSPDLTIMRVEAHQRGRVLSFSLVDRYDPRAKMTSMMRTTAWPASVVVQMLVSGAITKRGGIYQESDVPAEQFLREMEKRGIRIEYAEQVG